MLIIITIAMIINNKQTIKTYEDNNNSNSSFSNICCKHYDQTNPT